MEFALGDDYDCVRADSEPRFPDLGMHTLFLCLLPVSFFPAHHSLRPVHSHRGRFLSVRHSASHSIVEIVAICVAPALANTLGKFLATNLPAPELMHFKRVSKLDGCKGTGNLRKLDGGEAVVSSPDSLHQLAILICPRLQFENAELFPSAVAKLLGDASFAQCTRAVIGLPTDPPRCSEEWARWSQCWSLAIPPPRPIQRFVFTAGDDERQAVQAMRIATLAALRGTSHNSFCCFVSSVRHASILCRLVYIFCNAS